MTSGLFPVSLKNFKLKSSSQAPSKFMFTVQCAFCLGTALEFRSRSELKALFKIEIEFDLIYN